MADITLLLLNSDTWNHLPMFKRMSFGSMKNLSTKWVYKLYILNIYVKTWFGIR